MLNYLLIVLVVLTFSSATLGNDATEETPVERQALIVHSVGLLDADGTTLYSVLIANQSDESLSEVTVTSSLPNGETFVEAFWTPESAKFQGESNGEVTWTVQELPAATILGPFTYRVAFEDEDMVKPLNVGAMVAAGIENAARKAALVSIADGTSNTHNFVGSNIELSNPFTQSGVDLNR
jgi:uncharacterized repeat protein (TIGR01451 family)